MTHYTVNPVYRVSKNITTKLTITTFFFGNHKKIIYIQYKQYKVFYKTF